MADGDIQIDLGDGGFRLHDIAIAVIGFGDDRFRPGFRAGRYLVHLPENIREDGLLAVVHGGHLLGVIRVGGRLDGIDGKHLRPDGAGAGHLQHVMGQIGLCGVDLLLVIIVDLLHHVLHGIARTAVLTGKENAEAGADQKPDEADNDNDQHGDPAPGSDGGDQRLGGCNNGFHRRDGGLGCNLCSRNRRPCRSAGRVGGGPGGSGRGLGSPLGGFGRLLAGLDTGLRGFFRRLDGFAGGFYRPFGGRGRLLDGLAAPVHGFNAFLPPIQGLDGPALLPERLYWLGDPVRRLPGFPRRLLLGLFFRLFGCGFPLLDILLDLGDVLLCGLYPFAALLVKLVDRFMGDAIHPGRKTVGRILAGGAFRRIQAVVGLIFGADICLFHPFRGHRRFVNGLNSFFGHPCFNALAHGLHLLSRAGAPLFLQQLCHNHHPPVCPGILAGGKGDKLVAIFRAYARFVKRQRLALGNKPVKSPGALRIDKVVILEAFLRVGYRLKGGDYFIFAKAVQSIKADGLVFPVKILAFILAQVGEHTAVVHVMAVQHQIVGNADVAVFLHIGHPIAAVRLIKSVLQIEVGVILGLHDRIINPGAGNGNPAHQVAVLGVHIRIFLKGRKFFRLWGRVIGKFQRGRLYIFLN